MALWYRVPTRGKGKREKRDPLESHPPIGGRKRGKKKKPIPGPRKVQPTVPQGRKKGKGKWDRESKRPAYQQEKDRLILQRV